MNFFSQLFEKYMRDDFPVLEKVSYFNTAYTGLISNHLRKWKENQNKMLFDQADSYYSDKKQLVLENTKDQLSAFLNADKSSVFLSTSFSVAFQNFLFYVPKKSKVLMFKNDYPSIQKIVVEHQLDFTELEVTENLENELVNELESKEYNILIISPVHYNTGLKFKMECLEQIKTKFPNLIILADGTQFVGAHPFNFNKSHLDGIFASGYKWLLAGDCNGFACLKKELLEKLNLTPEDVSNFYDKGNHDFINLGALGVSLQYIQHFGFEKLLERKRKLTERLYVELKKRKLLIDLSVQRSEFSSILILKLNDSQFQTLLKHGIRCIQRGVGVRISIHYYNSQDDINHLLDVLDKHLCLKFN